MDLSKKNKISLVLVGILLVFCSSVFREVIQTQDWLVNHQVNHFREEISKCNIRLDNELERYLNVVDTNSFEVLLKNGVEYHRNLEKEGYGIYLYEDNNLKFWSSHKFIIPEKNVENGFVKEKNGFYLYKKIESNGITLIGQYLIKKNYRFENSYVINSFQDELYLGDDWLVSKIKFDKSEEVSIKNNSLYILPKDTYSPPVNKYLIVIELLGLFLFGLGIVLFAFHCNVKWKFCVILPFILFNRFIFWYAVLPTNLYELDMFELKVSPFSTMIPSLGDLILNVFFVLVLIVSVLRGVKIKSNSFKPVYYVVNVLILILLYLLSWCVIETIEIMVMNLEIPLDLSNILLIESSTIIALLCVSGILGI